MAYSTSNPPRIVVPSFTGQGNIWAYSSSDVMTGVDLTGYIANGDDLGMIAGDLVLVRDTINIKTSMHYVVSVTASSAADLSDGTVVGSSANAD